MKRRHHPQHRQRAPISLGAFVVLTLTMAALLCSAATPASAQVRVLARHSAEWNIVPCDGRVWWIAKRARKDTPGQILVADTHAPKPLAEHVLEPSRYSWELQCARGRVLLAHGDTAWRLELRDDGTVARSAPLEGVGWGGEGVLTPGERTETPGAVVVLEQSHRVLLIDVDAMRVIARYWREVHPLNIHDPENGGHVFHQSSGSFVGTRGDQTIAVIPGVTSKHPKELPFQPTLLASIASDTGAVRWESPSFEKAYGLRSGLSEDGAWGWLVHGPLSQSVSVFDAHTGAIRATWQLKHCRRNSVFFHAHTYPIFGNTPGLMLQDCDGTRRVDVSGATRWHIAPKDPNTLVYSAAALRSARTLPSYQRPDGLYGTPWTLRIVSDADGTTLAEHPVSASGTFRFAADGVTPFILEPKRGYVLELNHEGAVVRRYTIPKHHHVAFSDRSVFAYPNTHHKGAKRMTGAPWTLVFDRATGARLGRLRGVWRPILTREGRAVLRGRRDGRRDGPEEVVLLSTR